MPIQTKTLEVQSLTGLAADNVAELETHTDQRGTPRLHILRVTQTLKAAAGNTASLIITSRVQGLIEAMSFASVSAADAAARFTLTAGVLPPDFSVDPVWPLLDIGLGPFTVPTFNLTATDGTVDPGFSARTPTEYTFRKVNNLLSDQRAETAANISDLGKSGHFFNQFFVITTAGSGTITDGDAARTEFYIRPFEAL